MERPAATAARAGCDTGANHADGQTHQCRFSLGRLDPARQHHDAGAGYHAGARAAFGRVDAGGQCAIAFAAAGDSVGAGCGQEAGRGAEIRAYACAGSACTCCGSAGARGVE